MINISSNYQQVVSELQKIPKKLRKKLVKKVLSPESIQLKKSIQDVVPVKTGALRRSIGINTEDYTRRVDQSGDIIVSVSVRTTYKDKNGKQPSKYYKVVEYKSKKGRLFFERGFGKFVGSSINRMDSNFKNICEEINKHND